MSSFEIKDEGLRETLRQAAKAVRRMPIHSCGHCLGRGVRQEETYNDGWDRYFENVKCMFCGGSGNVGGGQPSLTLYFQSEEERTKFKARLLKMRGMTWEDEGNTLETSNAASRFGNTD